MKCRSKKIADSKEFPISNCRLPIQNRKSKIVNWKSLNAKPAFSLVEATVALILLALISSSVLVVINRCMASAADSAARCQAFEVARENMETLLSKDSVKEIVEYGSSDKYPEIQWQTTVEAFYESISSRMWIRGICSAEYTDTAGQLQTIELTHWLTSLTKKQVIEIIEQQRKRKDESLKGIESTVSYEGKKFKVKLEEDIVTIGQKKFKLSGESLEEYKDKGKVDLKKLAVDTLKTLDDDEYEELVPVSEQKPTEQQQQDDAERICGYTIEEFNQMEFGQVWQILSNCPEFWQ